MELALTLVIITILDLIITVWLLARHREFLRRLNALEVKYGSRPDAGTPVVDFDNKSLRDAISNATPEDISAAKDLLSSLGAMIDKDN